MPVVDADFVTTKTAILDLISSNNCRSANIISERMNSFDDAVMMLYEYAPKLKCNTTYLMQLLALVDDAKLVERGVYVNKTGTNINGPKFVVASTYDTISLLDGFPPHVVHVVNGSHIGTIRIIGNTRASLIVISSGAVVDLLDIDSTSGVDNIGIISCGTSISNLAKIKNAGYIGLISHDEDSLFGGISC